MYEDFYNEGPSDFDIAIEEFKEGLRKTVKEEILNEMAHLRKENEELQEVKENFDKIKQEYKDKERQFNIKEDEMMRTLARKKIEELITIADVKKEIYFLEGKSGYVPKCNKCDDKRLIHFKSPSGKDCTEPCPVCGKSYYMYFVKPVDSISIEFNTDPCIRSRVYYKRRDCFSDSTTYTNYTNQDILDGNPDEFDYEHFNQYYIAFESKELAQQICDRINKKNGVPDNAKFEE